MRVTREQLEAYSFAKKKDAKKPELTQLEIQPDGTATATNGVAVAIVSRKTNAGDAKGRAFRALVPTNVARTVLDQMKREGFGTSELHKESEGPTFYVQDPEVEEKEGLVTRFHPTTEEFPAGVIEAVDHATKGAPRARIALGSHVLSLLSGLRGKIGGQGPVKIEVRGELDPVICTWNDDKGHDAKVVIMPIKLEPHEWQLGGMQLHAPEPDEEGEDTETDPINEEADDADDPSGVAGDGPEGEDDELDGPELEEESNAGDGGKARRAPRKKKPTKKKAKPKKKGGKRGK